jgi:predicted anti-sigma-YlaC factor YlaD
MWPLRRLTCKQMVELVTDYLEGAMPPRTRRRFERHLDGCPGCRAYLEQMRDTVRVLGHLGEDDIPPAVLDELLRAFRDWSASGGGPSR